MENKLLVEVEKDHPSKISITLRLPNYFVAFLDKERARLRKQGKVLTRSALIETFLRKYLDEVK